MRCIIVGAGGHGRVVYDILRAAGEHEVVGFLDSDPRLINRRIDGCRVLGSIDQLENIRNTSAVDAGIVAIGDNGTRRAFADRMERCGLKLINAIHPSANIARSAIIGRNVVISAGALICAHCSIADSVILNTGCLVDHESMIGTATHICPGARLAGRVTIEAGVFVGIGASVIQSVHIGCEAVVGAGAVVIHDVDPMTTVVGVPARAIKRAPDPRPASLLTTIPERSRVATTEALLAASVR